MWLSNLLLAINIIIFAVFMAPMATWAIVVLVFSICALIGFVIRDFIRDFVVW